MSVSLSITADYGRIYVSGPDKLLAANLPGAAENIRRGSYELSLTLDSLRALRKQTGVSKEQFAEFLKPEVLAWARAAAHSDRVVNEMHEKLATGWRLHFPWDDNKGDKVGKYRPPFAHQKVMATVGAYLDGCAFLCEMGTAKTRPAIEVARHKLACGDLDNLIVLCPRGVMGTWERECEMWGLPGVTTLLIDMTVKDRIAIINNATTVLPRIFVINYDVISQMQHAVIQLCKRRKVGLIADEMHRIRNPRAKMSEATMEVAKHVKWRLGMTGSPILQGAHDIWSQWYLVDLGITFGANYVQFRRENFDENEYTFEIVPKRGTLERIGQKLRRRGLRYTKNECLDLPPAIPLPAIEVEMGKEQQRAYDEMADFLVARLEGKAVADPYRIDPETGLPFDLDDENLASAANQLVMILRLSQITSGFVPDVKGGMHFFNPNPKLDALVETIEENIVNHQILIWARYRLDHDLIAKRLSKYNPQILRGKVTQKKRDDIEIGFEEGRYRLIVGQPGAGGVGLNFQAASQAYWYSQWYHLEHRLQSEARNHRSGSERHEKITYQDFVCKGTVDLDVSAGLADKKSVADMVVDLKKRLGIAA